MGSERLYWFIVLLTLIYIVFENRKSPIKILIILCFYSGLAAFPGKSIENPYKVIVVVLALLLVLKHNVFSNLRKGETMLILTFILFSISFFYSAYLNGDYFNLTFSQYGKYFTPVCLFYIFSHILKKNPEAFTGLKSLFFNLLTIQIILSVFKLFTIGLNESTVGTISYIGGGPATMIPVLGFILVWLDRQGELRRKDWIYVLLLVFIAFASVKRAIWFIMPAMIILFVYYIPRKLKVNHVLYALPIIPVLLYAGARLNPTLNKEGKVGGSFNLQYVWDYSMQYSFGKTSESEEIKKGVGRGGATILLFSKLFENQTLSKEDYWGTSLKEMYTTDYEEFDDKKFGVNSKGAVTGVFQTYISSGYIGVFTTILFLITVCFLVKEPRIRLAVLLLIFWDFFFYSALILRTQALFILFFFIILYSNLQFEQRLYDRYAKKMSFET